MLMLKPGNSRRRNCSPHTPSTRLSADASAQAVNCPPLHCANASARACVSTKHPCLLRDNATEYADANAVAVLPPWQKARAVACARAWPWSPPAAAASANAAPNTWFDASPPSLIACAAVLVKASRFPLLFATVNALACDRPNSSTAPWLAAVAAALASTAAVAATLAAAACANDSAIASMRPAFACCTMLVAAALASPRAGAAVMADAAVVALLLAMAVLTVLAMSAPWGRGGSVTLPLLLLPVPPVVLLLTAGLGDGDAAGEVVLRLGDALGEAEVALGEGLGEAAGEGLVDVPDVLLRAGLGLGLGLVAVVVVLMGVAADKKPGAVDGDGDGDGDGDAAAVEATVGSTTAGDGLGEVVVVVVPPGVVAVRLPGAAGEGEGLASGLLPAGDGSVTAATGAGEGEGLASGVAAGDGSVTTGGGDGDAWFAGLLLFLPLPLLVAVGGDVTAVGLVRTLAGTAWAVKGWRSTGLAVFPAGLAADAAFPAGLGGMTTFPAGAGGELRALPAGPASVGSWPGVAASVAGVVTFATLLPFVACRSLRVGLPDRIEACLGLMTLARS